MGVSPPPKKVLVIGSGPIVIGQSAEFDYSGNQAIKALMREGIEVIVANSNPATIQTDRREGTKPKMIPLDEGSITGLIDEEKPDAILGTFGGQTGLNLLVELWKSGVLSSRNVKILGTQPEAVEIAEDRLKFKERMVEIGEPVLESYYCSTIQDSIKQSKQLGFPIVVRPSFTLGGSGGGIARNVEELRSIVEQGLYLSEVGSILIEKSVIGWNELEVEVVRDSSGSKIAVCTMENVDPMGVHTGDSIVVTPFLTLNDLHYQRIRNSALKIAERLNIVGACNVQFAFNDESGEYYVIEVNPRLSRSSALASKATGYPIARVAALISLGKKLNEIENTVTGEKNAAREPAIDYVVVKCPVWPIEKFPEEDFKLGTQMKSTGEAMSIGRSLTEAFRKSLRSTGMLYRKVVFDESLLSVPNPERELQIFEAFKRGYSIEKIASLTGWKKLFVSELIAAFREDNSPTGFSIVDTCAGEFDVKTPYYYSSDPGGRIAGDAIVLGGGPITIGQGIEFDYSCVHISQSLRKKGIRVIMVNDNPETVSTDFDESDYLVFDPVDFETVKNVVNNSTAKFLVPWFGGQRPINILRRIQEEFGDRINILGTSVESIETLEVREKFAELMRDMNIPYPEYLFSSTESFMEVVKKLSFPVIVRPSYTISGAHMAILKSMGEAEEYLKFHGRFVKEFLVEKYLENSIEAEIDGVSDGEGVLIPGIIEHIEEAGIHSGDSISIFPSRNIPNHIQETMKEYTKLICRRLGIVGPINIQFAIKDNVVHIIEINPRSSRTFPFVSKISGINLSEISADVLFGNKLVDKPVSRETVGVKVPIFPFDKLKGSDVVLGPEMKSTGEVIGIGKDLRNALLNGYRAAGYDISKEGVIISITSKKINEFLGIVRIINNSGKVIYSTEGTHDRLAKYGINTVKIKKIFEGSQNALDLLKLGNISGVVNILSENYKSENDGKLMRRACYERKVLYMSTRTQAAAFAEVISDRNLPVIEPWSRQR
ncbi:MAG: carbamoyl-phosphate synthase large subunit [Thermoplasmatales archaeon]|nr:carbamoyl-phosphate synthase large subunit [Candidatus Thermoplasmatota archaeon]MDA8054105.1 carbamoyl-phosphate synthase large subunit [Thermoplasmatales archaeon]